MAFVSELTEIHMSKPVNVSDYTLDPLGRYPEDGPGNGEDFRKNYLLPPLKDGETVDVYLDGINDEYGSSFIVEAFANLIRIERLDPKFVKAHLNLISKHDDWKVEILDYIEEAAKEFENQK